ncbi:hypothetical protein NQD34_016157 [Periophthalmus magnuspinnatus]|uniref:Uncharacterized protein n=1 Tax=Periophthalmus magnuspinnatus TaxID=409849 RepID=A0A3B3ZCD6_9GOBI|nr:myc target protein 1 homolog [Periophthalmus magnuspinnatus]KAJ0008742.1 hypothetical protein NQD34_016157 [Periophthalmus magnuspinnatus]
MAQNDTHPLLGIFNSFNHSDMLLAFCLSMLVGLLLGALVYVLLTWASRRKATAKITRRSKKKSVSSSRSSHPMSSHMGLYRSTFLSVYRQPSLEPVGPLGSKPSPETSTFRPLPKKNRPSLDMGEDTKVLEDMTSNSDSSSPVPNKRHSFWLGNNGLKGFFPLQSSPPAYDSVIHAFEETCT